MEAPAWDCDRFQLIDTLQQTALWDSIFSKLSGYGLKVAVTEMGLVKRDDRLDIGAEVWRYWADGDTETIAKYLRQDLEDTALLWHKLIPAKYFQRAYMPMTLQRICTTGTGSWWNQYMRMVNGADYAPGYQVAAYQGAITFYYAGVWRDCVKLDFGAMYPNIIEWLQLCPHNDHEKMNAKTVAFVKRFRKELQKESRQHPKGSREFNNLDGQQSTAKVLANSDYGLFNTMGLQFNDPYVGAMVTWAARQLARFVMQYCVDVGCVLVAIDTDGVVVYNPSLEGVLSDNKKAFFTDLEQKINDALPGNNYVEYEADIDFIWIPKVTGTKSVVAATQKGLDDKTSFIKDNPLHGEAVGLSKNYITMTRKKDGTISTTKKGKFKKRNRSWLDKTFVETFLLKWFDQGLDVACDYYQIIRGQIEDGLFPLERLQENVLVAKNWTTYEEWGFTLGEKYLTHYVYDEVGSKTKAGKSRKHKQYKRTDDVNEPYSREYYCDKIDELYMLLCGRTPDIMTPATDHDQLQLFAA
jgi:DNA polymerase elongation subunit (family B)